MVEAMLPFEESQRSLDQRDTSSSASSKCVDASSKPSAESTGSTSKQSVGVGTDGVPEAAVKPKPPPMNGRVLVGDWAKKSLGDWSTLAEDDDDGAVPDDWFEAANKNAGVEDTKAKNEVSIRSFQTPVTK